MNILVLNAGSSSLKYQVFDLAVNDQPLISGLFEHLNESAPVKHAWVDSGGQSANEALDQADYSIVFEWLFQFLASRVVLQAIAHRVVHGGPNFSEASLINDQVLIELRQLRPLAPLHNPVNLMGIELAQNHYPSLPQVAVFDTAFHHHLPEVAQYYALPLELQQQHGIRRYGFHGISHQFLAHEVARQLGQSVDRLKLITLHLGNGASVAAVRDGRCIDTSMGMTPLEGLVMGTRCGDLDAGVVMALLDEGYDRAALDQLLNHESGLRGLCGSNDMRVIETRLAQGDAAAQHALAMYCYRIKKYIGAYTAALGGLDALVFSGGVGEHSALVRAMCCDGLACLGIALDEPRNQQGSGSRRIDSSGTGTSVWVLSTHEELEIARQASRLLQA